MSRQNHIQLQAYLFFIAVPLNLFWEVARVKAYDCPESNLMADVIGCFVPSLGDGLLTLIMFWIGWAVFRNGQWNLNPGTKGYLLMLAVGLLLAIVVEWNALYRTGAWDYNERMIPILRVGLLPIVQMLILPPVTASLIQWIWTKDRQF